MINVRGYQKIKSKKPTGFLYLIGWQYILVLWAVCIFLIYILGNPFQKPGLDVIFFDIGQGDSILIRTFTGKNILIDGGSSTKRLTAKLNKLGVTGLDVVIASHHDRDHIGGFFGISKLMAGALILDAESAYMTPPKNPDWTNLAGNAGAQFLRVDSQNDIELEPGVFLDILYPINKESWTSNNFNNKSLVFRLIFGENCFFLGGDMEIPQEQLLISQGYNLNCNVYKASHHGSKSSSSLSMVRRIHPGISVLSYGKNNSYGHPHYSAVSNLKSVGSLIYGTGGNGDIKFNCDFVKCIVSRESY